MLEKRIAVYYEGQSLRGPAECFLQGEQAQELVEARLASWSKSGKTLILKKTKDEIWRRAQSLIMGQKVMELAAAGVKYFQEIVASWAPYAS